MVSLSNCQTANMSIFSHNVWWKDVCVLENGIVYVFLWHINVDYISVAGVAI